MEPVRLSAQQTAHLNTPVGTFSATYNLPVAMNEPPNARITLIEGETPAQTLIRVDVDERLHAHFVRQAPDGKPADVEVDFSPLRGAQTLVFVCEWSPTHMRIRIGDRRGHQVDSSPD